MSRRWFWQVVWSMAAAAVSLYIAYLVAHYYGIGPSAYEPKDFERQQLYEQTGKSTIERAER
ncbi:MAG TPA: hypothetical protein VLY45_00795 [Nitrospiria bacterium]|nr:hypothetical protein [Nitrospiria bacterium]